jgi:hypothetical protein
MRALVVYESMFGNTEAVAKAIAEGLSTQADVALVEVSTAPTVVDPQVALLVVGGPTHAHGMSTPDSRADASRRAGDQLVSHGVGIREWLAAIPDASAMGVAAAFDTRIHGPGILWGSAAKAMAKPLKAAGYRLVVPPESFLIGGPTGPMFDRLLDGELERARAWGGSLGMLAVEAETKRAVPV